jgi:hypothetical protein
VFKAKQLLSLQLQSTPHQIAGKNRFINTFQQAWTNRLMQPNRTIINRSRNFIQFSPRLRASA